MGVFSCIVWFVNCDGSSSYFVVENMGSVIEIGGGKVVIGYFGLLLCWGQKIVVKNMGDVMVMGDGDVVLGISYI